MEYDYDLAIEANERVILRKEPNRESEAVHELAAGERAKAATEVPGGDYSDCGGGTEWYPVEYSIGGTDVHGFVAMKCCKVV